MTTHSNGRLAPEILGGVGQGLFLRKDAAESFNAMRMHVRKKTGYVLTLNAGYRSYAKQVKLYNDYRAGVGNLAALPGTSNHGWGMAIDVHDYWSSRRHLDAFGQPFGWAKAWSDAPGEAWHIVFRPEVWQQNRATLVDPLAALLDDERQWLKQYLQLRHSGADPKARRRLWHRLRVRRRDIWRRAQRDGWDIYRRRERYAIIRHYIGG
jgi:D-alanyl-D-alanine carboxypeptidase